MNAARCPRIASALVLMAALAACKKDEPPAPAGPAPAPSASERSLAALAPPSAPPRPAPVSLLGSAAVVADPNPLKLPPRRINITAGKRVFTFSAEMLRGAKIGSTLVLYAATVAGLEGDDLIIEGRGGPSFKVHPGYVIPVPDDNVRLKPGDAVLTEWNGVMKHAVVTKLVKDKIGVRFTDMEARSAETFLPAPAPLPAQGTTRAVRFVKQSEGFLPGNYAAMRQGDVWRHVLLVSPAHEGDKKRWFCLGFGGAAQIADEADLRPIPVRFRAKAGEVVWAEWVGTMRKATVQSVDDPGLFAVKYERAGRPAKVGFGLIMPPIPE